MFRLNDSFVPSLAAEALRVAQGASTFLLKASNASGETAFGQSTGLNHIRIGDITVPTDDAGGVYLKFRHYNKAEYIPAWKVLAGQVAPDDIDGRIILVGTSAPGLLDLPGNPGRCRRSARDRYSRPGARAFFERHVSGASGSPLRRSKNS